MLRSQLLSSAESLCSAFASKQPLETVLSRFSTTHQKTVIEHGLPSLAPFLGRIFNDPKEYFTLISTLLSFENMEFSEYMVDTELRRVNVKGKAKFTWVETGQAWDEVFTYILDFDHEAKVTDYQVFADTGACYLARVGKLEEVGHV
jgi:hypothetical protein